MSNFLQSPLVPTGPMGVGTITSQAFNLSKLGGCSFQPKWSGTPTGTFTILVSDDYGTSPALTNPANPTSVGTWTNLGASIPTNPSGVPGNTYVPVFASCAAWICLQYVGTAGVGVLSGYYAGKEFG